MPKRKLNLLPEHERLKTMKISSEGMMAEEIVLELQGVLSTKKPTLSGIIKEFHLFVKRQETNIAQNITLVLENFHTTTNLQKLLKIKLINKYRVHDEVLRLLLSGDSLDVNQALKCSWFFIDIKDPARFADDFIPGLSLSTRLKVLHKYASFLRNTKAGEAVYEGVKARYGARTAITIMPACGENFIRNELPNVKIALPPGVVLALFKKYPSLTTEYIKYLAADPRKQRKLHQYSTVLSKLASKDLETFLKLAEEHKALLCIKLGRRPTKKLLKTQNDKVLNNYSKFQWLLKSKTFFSRLSLEQFKKLYISDLLPPDVSQFLSGARLAEGNLRYIKPNLRSNLILTTFKEKYGRDIVVDEILYNLQDVWVKYLPVEYTVKWLERKIQENISDAETQAKYIAQLPVENAMPRLKKLIESQSNARVRCSIASSLVETVEINKCSTGIKDLFAYFVKRFRNETWEFRGVIVRQMIGLEELFLEIESDDWVPIIDLINIMKLNREVYDNFNIENKLVQVMGFRVQNALIKKGNVEQCLEDYLQLAMGSDKSVNYFPLKLCEGTPYRGYCLQWLSKAVPRLKWTRTEFKNGFHTKLYENLIKYNVEHPDSKIPLPDWLKKSINAILNDSQTYFHTIKLIEDCAKQSGEVNLWREILKKNAFKNFRCEAICEILEFEPSFIKENILKIMKNSMEYSINDYSTFYKKIRLYEAFEIPSEVAKLCRVALKLEDPDFVVADERSLALESSQPCAIRVLSIILSSADFLKIALNFAPTTSKVEGYSEEIQALHDIQKAIGRSFVDVSSASDVLPVLQKFASGDYLKFVSGSLTAVCQRIPEKQILPLLKGSLDCPVSLRKHYLKLLYKIAPTEERVETFVTSFKSEKNVSLRLVLFQLLRKAFIDEPDDDTYRTFESLVNQLSVEDEEALKEVFNVQQVDESFVGRYLELIWGLAPKWAAVVPNGRSNILKMLTCREVKLVSEDFFGELLSFELLSKLPTYSPAHFVSLYLLHAPSSDISNLRLSKVMNRLLPLIQHRWDDYEFSSHQVFFVRHIISDLVHTLCSEAPLHVQCSPVQAKQLLENLKVNLSPPIKPSQFIRESLNLDLSIKLLQHKRSNLPSDAFVEAVVDLYKTYLHTYSRCQYPLVEYLIECAPSDIKTDLAVALTSDPNKICQIIGMKLIATHVPNEQALPDYKTLIENLLTSDNPAIQAVADNFFKSLTSNII